MATPSAMVRLRELVTACAELAAVAGMSIRQIIRGGVDLKTIDKANGSGAVDDPQTLADLTAQHIIVDSLRGHWPGLQIIGEEGSLPVDPSCVHPVRCKSIPAIDHASGPLWDDALDNRDITIFVDPLDGTKEFTEGIYSAVTVLVGISWRGQPVAGVIHQPFFTEKQQRSILGAPGVGVFSSILSECDSEQTEAWTQFTPPTVPKARKVVGTSRSHGRKEIDDAITAVVADKVIRTGGAGNKVLQLLEGTIDCYLYPCPGTKRWDTCAPEAVLLACGGILTDRRGKQYAYHFDEASVKNSDGVVAVLDPARHPLYISACAASL